MKKKALVLAKSSDFFAKFSLKGDKMSKCLENRFFPKLSHQKTKNQCSGNIPGTDLNVPRTFLEQN